MAQERMDAQLAFLREADKLKSILRHSRVSFADRRENDAEHSWHLALAVMILADHAIRQGRKVNFTEFEKLGGAGKSPAA